jgi:hypothetical protein
MKERQGEKVQGVVKKITTDFNIRQRRKGKGMGGGV